MTVSSHFRGRALAGVQRPVFTPWVSRRGAAKFKAWLRRAPRSAGPPWLGMCERLRSAHLSARNLYRSAEGQSPPGRVDCSNTARRDGRVGATSPGWTMLMLPVLRDDALHPALRAAAGSVAHRLVHAAASDHCLHLECGLDGLARLRWSIVPGALVRIGSVGGHRAPLRGRPPHRRSWDQMIGASVTEGPGWTQMPMDLLTLIVEVLLTETPEAEVHALIIWLSERFPS